MGSSAWFDGILSGARVGCDYRGSHRGVLLARNDVRAWRGSVALGAAPTQAAVDAHVAWCAAQGTLADTRPVLWPWGVMWERGSALYACDERPYAECIGIDDTPIEYDAAHGGCY